MKILRKYVLFFEIAAILFCSGSCVQHAAAFKAANAEIAPKGKYYIKMDNILQRPELPTGCEATALTIVLNHLGFKVGKCEIVDKYMPKTGKKYSLNTHFIGDPYSENGFGCNAPVIVKTANAYFKAAGGVGSAFQAVRITGNSPEELYRYVAQGCPIICWVTIRMKDTYISRNWTAENTGEKINFMIHEHCTVLVGYDTDQHTVSLNDPWEGNTTYPMQIFEKRYSQLGKQAVIIR